MKKLMIFVLGVVVGAIGALGAMVYLSNRGSAQDGTPIPKQTEYAGLHLGMTQDEVKRIKGYPPTVFEDTVVPGFPDGLKSFISTAGLEKEKGKRVEDYNEWSYNVTGGRIDLAFSPDKTSLIVITCYANDLRGTQLSICPAIGGIADGNTEQEVLGKFGKPDIVRIDGVTKRLYYKMAGVQFWLSSGKVYMLDIRDTRD